MAVAGFAGVSFLFLFIIPLNFCNVFANNTSSLCFRLTFCLRTTVTASSIITSKFKAWRQSAYPEAYSHVPEFCYSAKAEEIIAKDYTLVLSRYIEFINRDDNMDYDQKMKSLQAELSDLNKKEELSKADLIAGMKELGYEKVLPTGTRFVKSPVTDLYYLLSLVKIMGYDLNRGENVTS